MYVSLSSTSACVYFDILIYFDWHVIHMGHIWICLTFEGMNGVVAIISEHKVPPKSIGQIDAPSV